MPILTSFTFNDLVKPRKLRLVRNLNSFQIAKFKYAAENAFPGAGVSISTEFPIYEISRLQKWVKIEIPGSHGHGFFKLTEDEVKSYFHISW
jgi:hypothetical protein